MSVRHGVPDFITHILEPNSSFDNNISYNIYNTDKLTSIICMRYSQEYMCMQETKENTLQFP